MSMDPIPVVVLGASGYVGAEVLRLVAQHPRFALEAAVARSVAGKPIVEDFPHFRGVYDGVNYVALGAVDWTRKEPVAIFSCLPHGKGAELLDGVLRHADTAGRPWKLVDLAADFRLPDAQQFEAVYGERHGAPERYVDFACALPELTPGVVGNAMAHPGCFTTATTLACAPLMALGLAEPELRVSAVTGSTGSGREVKPATHHPERHGNFSAYNPLRHRHVPEMEMLLGRLGGTVPKVLFVPHSGPFARGIHATVHVRLVRPMTSFELRDVYAQFYAEAPFVHVEPEPPKLKQVVGTNRCHLGVCAVGQDAVIFSVIDNLIKGAAGGAMHWMNRLYGLPETAGLTLPGLGWS